MSLLAAAAGLTAGALGAAGLGRLREHRAAPRGLADLLGWGFLVGEGVVLMKDGSFLAGVARPGPRPRVVHGRARSSTWPATSTSRSRRSATGGWSTPTPSAATRPATPRPSGATSPTR